MQLERELTLRLAATRELRDRQRNRIVAEARAADLKRLVAVLHGERLLPLLGTRLLDLAPGVLSPAFSARVLAATHANRLSGAVVEEASARALGALRQAGVPSITLKGPRLARDLHGDLGLRGTRDIDLLVGPEDFRAAVAALRPAGWREREQPAWHDGLPLFECALDPREAGQPAIDLHWRVHWYEERFSRQVLERLTSAGSSEHQAHVLACLLLMWSRDGFCGLRHGADVSAWWDRHGDPRAEGLLEPIVLEHPSLEPALRAAALLADRLLGVPARGLLAAQRVRARRGRGALRLAGWAHGAPRPRLTVFAGQHPQAVTRVILADWLLAPSGARLDAVRRHVLPPAAVVCGALQRPAHSRAHRTVARGRYALLISGEVVARGVPVMWFNRRARIRPAGA